MTLMFSGTPDRLLDRIGFFSQQPTQEELFIQVKGSSDSVIRMVTTNIHN